MWYLVKKLGQLQFESFHPFGLNEGSVGASEQLKHAVSPFQQVLQRVVLQYTVPYQAKQMNMHRGAYSLL